MSSQSKIADIMTRLHQAKRISDTRGKGEAGEEAVLAITLERLQHTGGVVWHSYRYPYQKTRGGQTYLGNIKYEGGHYYDVTGDLEDEIDVLYISPYRIIPIEVKAYAGGISIYDYWMDRQKDHGKVYKSPITQSEKHARHLYHALSDVIPDGDPSYIIPMVCFVDKCQVKDDRSPSQQRYIPCCILNNLNATIAKNNTPLKYNLNVEMINHKLNELKLDGREFK